MPIHLECPECGRQFSTHPEKVGKTVACPACKLPVKVRALDPELLSLDADPEASANPDPFDFHSGSTHSNRREVPDDWDDERPRVPQKKSKWSSIASGSGGVQIGLIVLAIAFTFLVFIPQFIDARVGGLKLLQAMARLLVLSFVIFFASAACFCFGHMTGSSAPDPKSNKLANWSLGISALSALLFCAFFGLFIYYRFRIEHFIKEPEEGLWVLRGVGLSFVLAVVTLWIAEMIFLGLLMRVGRLFAYAPLTAWSKVLFIVLAIFLGAFVLFVGFIAIQLNREADGAGATKISRDDLLLGLYVIYVLSMAFLGCYWYTLRLGKQVLLGTKHA